jgi:hypothetical protein
MNAAQRRAYFAAHALGLSLLILTYVLLTVMRSIRDDFAVEIWRDLDFAGEPAVFAQSETLVMLGVVMITGATILIRNNQRALQVSVVTIIGGFVLVCLAVMARRHQGMGGFPFMVLTGLGMYIPYVAFHTTVFERLIAVFRDRTNIGYLMYMADAMGYLGYVGVMVWRNLAQEQMEFLRLFERASLIIAGLSILFVITSLVYFQRKTSARSAVALDAAT